MDAGGISAIIFAILFAVVGVAYGHKLYSEGAFSMPTGDAVSLDFLSLLILYMPNTLFVYGFIADIMNQKYQYSISGITALFGMFFNKFVGGTVVGGIASGTNFIVNKVRQAPAAAAAVTAAIGLGAAAAAPVVAPVVAAAAPTVAATTAAVSAAPAAAVSAAPIIAPAAAAAAATTAAVANIPENANNAEGIRDSSSPFLTQMDVGGRKQRGGATDLCSLPGFEWLENKTAPQGIIMSMTVLWYLLIEMWDTGQGSQSIALGVTTAIVFLLQWAVLHKSKCLDSYTFGTWSAIIALVMAITFAGSSYGIQKLIYTASGGVNTPSSGQSSSTPASGKVVCPKGSVLNPEGECVVPLGPGGSEKNTNNQSQPVDDNDQFVCEAYKDGELVTSTIVD